MWPFNVSTKADAQSGVVTCDGKHHHFSIWRDIQLQENIWKKGMSEPMTCLTDAQERTCVICQYKERRGL